MSLMRYLFNRNEYTFFALIYSFFAADQFDMHRHVQHNNLLFMSYWTCSVVSQHAWLSSLVVSSTIRCLCFQDKSIHLSNACAECELSSCYEDCAIPTRRPTSLRSTCSTNELSCLKLTASHFFLHAFLLHSVCTFFADETDVMRSLILQWKRKFENFRICQRSCSAF